MSKMYRNLFSNATPPPSGDGSPTSHITLFDITPTSPSSASNVHLVARATYFPEFRSMRFVIGTNKVEMPNFRQVGDQLEISTDWNTASLARGTYALAVEVATKSDPNWTSAERRVTTYTLIGSPTPAGRPPDRPVLKSPYNWYLKDASGADAPVELCVNPSRDPDGDPVQYIFEVYLPQGSTSLYRSSGPVASTCWTSTFPPNTYSWRAKASDGTNYSDWSQETWNFSVASANALNHVAEMYADLEPLLALRLANEALRLSLEGGFEREQRKAEEVLQRLSP